MDINDLAGVLLLNVSGDGEVIVLLGNFVVGDEGGEVRLVGAVKIGRQDRLDVVLGKLIAVGDLDALFGCVQKQRMVIALGLFQHHDAGRDRRAVEQVVRQLDDAVDEVVVDQVFADLLFRAAAVHHAGEADDGGGAVGGPSHERLCMINARSAFDFGASTPAGEKRGSLMSVALSLPSQRMEYGGFETMASNGSSSQCWGLTSVSPWAMSNLS